MHDEEIIRQKLQRYILDGTEAVEPIRFLLNSPNRPPDAMKAISAILRRQYADTVHIDAVFDLLDLSSPRPVRAPSGANTGLAPAMKEYDDERIDHVE